MANLTPRQQEAVEALGGSLLVSAAAGSGKTTVLTERVIRLLTGEDPIDADRIVVVTFTVAAADEMRRRIMARLAQRVEEEPGNRQLQNQMLLLPKAKICTIHKLCSTLIREHQQQLGLSGEPRILEEAELAVIKREALAALLEEYYDQKNPAFAELVEFTCVKNDRPLEELILAVYDFIRSVPFPLHFLEKTLALYQSSGSLNENPWTEGVSAYIVQALDACLSLLNGCLAEMEAVPDVLEKYGEAFQSDVFQLGRLRELVRQRQLEEAAEFADGMKKVSLKAVRNYEDPDFLDSLKSRRKRAYDVTEGLIKRFLCFSREDFQEDIEILLPKISLLFELVSGLYERIEQKKQEQGGLDYSDLEHYTLRLLAERRPGGELIKTETACILSAGFDQIMIDECQDVNPVQDLIFRLLSQDGTNLFMVGDVKQSIYRFRRASPQLFVEKRSSYTPYDPETHSLTSRETIVLEQNFRSRKEVCGLVNYLFSQIMSSEMGEIDYTAGEALVPGASYEDYPDCQSEVHILDYHKDAPGAEDKSQTEARYIGRMIQKMVQEGYQVQGPHGMRACTYRDFAVLLRSRKEKVAVYANALKAAGVPCYAASAEGYFEAYEVAVVLNLLRVLDNPLLDVPLVSVLMSPMFAFSPDKLAEIRLAQKKSPLYLAMVEFSEKGDVQCGEFLAFLAGLRRKAAVLPVDALIQEIYDQTDFTALVYAMGQGEQKDANLRLLLHHGERYEKVGEGGLSGFLRYLDRVMESGKDFSCANTVSARADCVQILSIHASKGLEFPVCIVADCGKRFNKTDLNGRCQFHSELGFSMKITDPETMRSYTSFPFEAIRLQNERETVSEEMRVLYVAMTRAKEKLILVMTLPSAAEQLRTIADSIAASLEGGGARFGPHEVFSTQGYEGWILRAMLRHPDFADIRKEIGRIEIPLLLADFPVKGVLVSEEEVFAQEEEAVRVFREKADPLLCGRLRQTLDFVYDREPLTRIPAKLTVTQIAKQAQEETIQLSARPVFLQRQGFTPAQRGSVLHSFMQFADFGAAERDLSGEIDRLKQQKFLTPEEAEILNREKITAFFRTDLYQRMKTADEFLREYKFLYFLRAGEIDTNLAGSFAEEKVLIQGIADCLIFEPRGITIVDYKTDYTEDEQMLIERYFDQLRIYKEAIGQAFSRPVCQCLLYALHLEREIEIPCV